jgi:hypothetical protein
MITDAKLVQPARAYMPIEVTELGMVTEVILEFAAKFGGKI